MVKRMCRSEPLEQVVAREASRCRSSTASSSSAGVQIEYEFPHPEGIQEVVRIEQSCCCVDPSHQAHGGNCGEENAAPIPGMYPTASKFRMALSNSSSDCIQCP